MSPRKVPKDFRKMVEEVLQEFGVERWKWGWGGHHPYVTFEVGGQPVKLTLPGSPSDRRALLNCRGDIRRVCRQHSIAEAR